MVWLFCFFLLFCFVYSLVSFIFVFFGLWFGLFGFGLAFDLFGFVLLFLQAGPAATFSFHCRGGFGI